MIIGGKLGMVFWFGVGGVSRISRRLVGAKAISLGRAF